MAKQGRRVESKKKPRRARAPKPKPFREIVFGDLHLNPVTLERGLRVLQLVGEYAEQYDADIVCTGDFWDVRGVLSTRHVDAVRKVIGSWSPKRKKRFIPGNHDQVSMNGLINGMCVIDGLNGVQVIHEPLEEDGLVFLPWREIPAEQKALFTSIKTANATIFAHAELGGATANNGRLSPGHVQVADYVETTRACYLGHYHKFHQVGDRSWYIGSPFEQRIDERDMQHGIALVTSEDISPQFIHLDEFPKHHVLTVSDSAVNVRAQDIAEVRMTADEMDGEAFDKVVAELPDSVRDRLRTRMIPDEKAEAEVPSFALGLDDAVEAYARENTDPQGGEGPDAVAMATLGCDLLKDIPDARAIAPLGHRVELDRIKVQDFCAIAGEFVLDVAGIRRGLIRAPIRTGKTAVFDAPMWCLYGATTPRKAGVEGSTLRADGVVNDSADSCVVECRFTVTKDDGTEVVVDIRRERKRGKGSKVTIDGIDMPDGISDQQQLVEHVIGLNHTLWRACVSLGQGAVLNFLTGADKSKKDLLSAAFGLDVCPAAQKVAKKKRDLAGQKMATLSHSQVRAVAARDELAQQDFAAEIESWETRHAAVLAELEERGKGLQKRIKTTQTTLAGEETWKDTQAQHETAIATLTKRLASLTPKNRVGELQRQFGAIESEKAVVQRDYGILKKSYSDAVAAKSSGQAIVCEKCGQPLTGAAEHHFQDFEAQIKSKEHELKTFVARLNNVAVELDNLNTAGSAEIQAAEQSIEESRTALKQCTEAQAQFARIRQTIESMEREVVQARADYAREDKTVNPFKAKQAENATRIAQLTAEAEGVAAELVEATQESENFQFWVDGFGSKGIPALVLRMALYDLESAANRYLADLTEGTLHTRLKMEGDDLQIDFIEQTIEGPLRDRQYQQLSGGQRRCAELAFSPFALSDLVFSRCGVQVSLLMVDELTTHMGDAEKSRACDILERSSRRNILVIDHDAQVQGRFETVMELSRDAEGTRLAVV